MTTTRPPKLTDIAARISAHLERFERDPKINASCARYKTTPYYHARAFRAGAYVRVQYVSYQGQTPINRQDAMAYLDWLDAGNVGRHFEFLREGEA